MTPCHEVASADRRYPRQKLGGRFVYRHRVAYEAERGPIPPGMTIDHLCFNRKCVNVDHMEAVTASENTKRWARAQGRLVAEVPGVSRCGHGHAADWRKGLTSWECRACRRERQAAHRDRRPVTSEL